MEKKKREGRKGGRKNGRKEVKKEGCGGKNGRVQNTTNLSLVGAEDEYSVGFMVV